MREAVCDTSPLQYLHQIRQLDLLPQLWSKLLVPHSVAAELTEGSKLGCDLPDPAELPWCRIIQCGSPGMFEDLTRLGRGEKEAIILASEKRLV